MRASFAERYAEASEHVRHLIDSLLDQDETDRAWAEHIGPVMSQQTAAKLLGKSKQAVSADKRLLELRTGNGRVVYPVFQFDGPHPLRGLDQVVPMLSDAATSKWTVASWLVSPSRELNGRRPVDALREDDADSVLRAAKAFAHDLAR